MAKKHLFETYVLFMCWWWVLSQKKWKESRRKRTKIWKNVSL